MNKHIKSDNQYNSKGSVLTQEAFMGAESPGQPCHHSPDGHSAETGHLLRGFPAKSVQLKADQEEPVRQHTLNGLFKKSVL